MIKPGIAVVAPNPKSSGGARWAFLAAYADALEKNNHDDVKARDFIAKLYKNVPILDSGARGLDHDVRQRTASATCCWRGKTRRTWRIKEFGADKFEIVTPPLSILAEPTVAVVDKNAGRHGTLAVARAYLEYLYSDEGQEIAARNFYRPRNAAIAAKYAGQFSPVKLVTIDQEFGGWTQAQEKFFSDGGVFDQIYQP